MPPAATRRQRLLDWGLTLFFAIVLYEGALRKWVWPDAELYLYFVKDAVLLVLLVYAGMSVGGALWSRMRLRGALRNLAVLYAFWVMLEALNPELPNLALGLFGAKNYVYYLAIVPLVCVAYDTPDQAWPLIRRILWLSIPVFVVGIVQFYSPYDAAINRYVRAPEYGVATFGVGRYARVTGTFPYITGMSTLLFAVCVLALGWLAARRWSIGASRVVLLAGALALIVTPMTGSRWSALALAISVPVFFVGMWYRGMLTLTRLFQIVAVVGLLAVVVAQAGSEAYGGLRQRAATAGDAPERYRSLLVRPFELVVDAGVIGFGAGSTHQAAPSIAREVLPYSWLPVPLVEDELPRIALELGLPGFAVTLALRLVLVWLAWRCLIRARSDAHLALAGSALMYLMIYIFSNSAFNTTAGIFYWFFAGLLLLVLREQSPVPAPAQGPFLSGVRYVRR